MGCGWQPVSRLGRGHPRLRDWPRVARGGPSHRGTGGKFLHISTDFYHPLWVELAEKLDAIALFQEDAQCFMTNSGTEAVEAAIKLARYHTRRPCFIGFYGAFHGRTMGALAFTASKSVQRAGFFPMLSGVTHIPYPDPY